jgi:hypothetical protein
MADENRAAAARVVKTCMTLAVEMGFDGLLRMGKWLKRGEVETTFNVEIAHVVMVEGHPEDQEARAYLSLSTSGRMIARRDAAG